MYVWISLPLHQWRPRWRRLLLLGTLALFSLVPFFCAFFVPYWVEYDQTDWIIDSVARNKLIWDYNILHAHHSQYMGSKMTRAYEEHDKSGEGRVEKKWNKWRNEANDRTNLYICARAREIDCKYQNKQMPDTCCTHSQACTHWKINVQTNARTHFTDKHACIASWLNSLEGFTHSHTHSHSHSLYCPLLYQTLTRTNNVLFPPHIGSCLGVYCCPSFGVFAQNRRHEKEVVEAEWAWNDSSSPCIQQKKEQTFSI